MAKLPKQPKINPESFPNEKFMPQLLEPINGFMDDVKNALNKNLTFSENIAGSVVTALIDGVYPIDIMWTLTSRPVGAWLVQCREVSNVHVAPSNALSIDWMYTGTGKFRINSILGLSSATAANKYIATILVITG